MSYETPESSVTRTASPRLTENDVSPFSSSPSITSKVTSPEVTPVTVNSAAEPPGTLSPWTTV